jgi:hypothetical protein
VSQRGTEISHILVVVVLSLRGTEHAHGEDPSSERLVVAGPVGLLGLEIGSLETLSCSNSSVGFIRLLLEGMACHEENHRTAVLGTYE